MANPPCDDFVNRPMGPHQLPVPNIPYMGPGCSNHPGNPAAYKLCTGRHTNANRPTVCDNCMQHTNDVLRTQPGPLRNMQDNNGTGINSRTPPQPWHVGNEAQTGKLDPTRGPPPIWPGFLTRMCSSCEDMAQGLHFFMSNNIITFPADTVRRWRSSPFISPLITCVCAWYMDLHPSVSRDQLCGQHLREAWNDRLQHRNTVEDWLRNAMKHPTARNVVQATTAKLKRRVRDGTYRACPCGNDVLPTGPTPAILPPVPRVWFCMGCLGYRFMANGPPRPTMPYMAPRPAVLAPGAVAPTNMRLSTFRHRHRRYIQNVLRRVGKPLPSA